MDAHKCRAMMAFLTPTARVFDRRTPLPAYAPELNPVKPLWGNVKGRELANVCAPDLARRQA